MKLLASALAVLSLALTPKAHAQGRFPDPANLRGERVQPRTGRELPIDGGEGNAALGLQQLLRKLSTRASLMLIVAHPDDEDGGMLTLYSRGQGARVATLTLTRGEGGQNAMTGDFEDALGLIRTQELLAADRYFGADQMFGTEVDFGFSKTKEEAFHKWTHERVLYDAVRAVRLYRPLVLAAVFIGGVSDGHGQHQVSGEIAQEVFKAAADPKVFPELTREGILPWAPLKVYARVPGFAITDKGLFDYATNQYVPPSFTNYVTGVTTVTPPTADVILHEGQTDPLLSTCAAHSADLTAPSSRPEARGVDVERPAGSAATVACKPLSYVQFARMGLGLQRTQVGPGARLATPGTYDVSYHRYGSRLSDQPTHEESFFDGVDIRLEAMASLVPHPQADLTQGLQRLAHDVDSTTAAFDPHHPDAIAPQLGDMQHHLGSLIDALEHEQFTGREDVLHELRVKQAQVNDALCLALGLQLESQADLPRFNSPEGNAVKVHTTLRANSEQNVGIFSQALDDNHGHRTEQILAVDTEPQLHAGKPYSGTLQSTPAQTQAPTQPYFFRADPEQSAYQLRDPTLRNAPATQPALTAWTVLRYRETEVDLGHIVEVADQALQVVPPASVTLPSTAAAFPTKQSSVQVLIDVTPPGTRVEADVPPHWKITPDVEVPGADLGSKSVQLQPPSTLTEPVKVRAVAVLGPGKEVHEGFRTVGYAGLPATNIYTDAAVRLVPVDLSLPLHRRVGYIPGTGDPVANNLRSVGFNVADLTVADLTPEHLAHFDTVILGVRTYNAHPDLHGAPTQALLDFARRGGNVIVQYQSAEFTAADAPFPLMLGSAEKVVDETTPVRLLDAEAIALSQPNRITSADFNGWIEERGHGFLQSWDPHYVALTETHDPGAPAEHIAPQAPQKGGLITTQLGAGHWTYVAFALYRQLPQAVPGAFRLLTNLIALADGKP